MQKVFCCKKHHFLNILSSYTNMLVRILAINIYLQLNLYVNVD